MSKTPFDICADAHLVPSAAQSSVDDDAPKRFDPKDAAELAQLRWRLAQLEQREADAIKEAARLVMNCGLAPNVPGTKWADILKHAGAIRDALAPFDDGSRAIGDEVAE